MTCTRKFEITGVLFEPQQQEGRKTHHGMGGRARHCVGVRRCRRPGCGSLAESGREGLSGRRAAAPRTALARGPKASVCPAGATDGRTSLSLPPDPCVVGTPVYTYGLLESLGASFTRAFGSPPPRLTSICPFSAASCRGVPPQESRVTGAPISSSRSRTGVWPPRAAKCRAVAPSLSRAVRLMSVKVTWGGRAGRGPLRLARAAPH